MIPGPSELILILLIVVMVFGAKRIPEIMNGIGQGIRSFKKAIDEDEPPATQPTPPPGPQTEAPKNEITPKKGGALDDGARDKIMCGISTVPLCFTRRISDGDKEVNASSLRGSADESSFFSEREIGDSSA